jgi:hypothetical protein
MRPFTLPMLLILITYASTGGQACRSADDKTIRGWLSDEVCARGRASSGMFTGTSPRCAKECVAKGRKIVLVDPEAKQVVTIENQSAARANIGDYVEVEGALNPRTKLLHIASLKMISTGWLRANVQDERAVISSPRMPPRQLA